MTRQTHLAAGIAVAAILTFPQGPTSAELLAAAVGSVLPDLDHPGQGNPLRWLISRSTGGHRGILHSPIVAALFGWAAVFACLFIEKSFSPWPFFFAISYFLHLALDSLTPMGIPLLYPITRERFALLQIRTGGPGDLLLGLLCILIIGLAWPQVGKILKTVLYFCVSLLSAIVRKGI